MQLAELVDALGYDGSRNFLRCGEQQFEAALDYGHVFRHAAAKHLG